MTDIVKVCTNLSNEQLKILRSHLFDKIKTIPPESDFSEGFDLYDRRKKKGLSEDIFIMGSCVVHEIEDARLKRILKPNSVSANLINNSISVDEQNPEPDSSEILQTCAVMKKCMTDMTKQLELLNTRVANLEGEITVLKCTVIQLTRLTANDKNLSAQNKDNQYGTPLENAVDSSLGLSSDAIK